MCAILPAMPQVLHTLPGRVRLHLPGWSGQGQELLENWLGRVRGVHRARANAATGNLLIHFDPQLVDEATLLADLAKWRTSSEPLQTLQPMAAADRRQGGPKRWRPAVRLLALLGNVLLGHGEGQQLLGREMTVLLLKVVDFTVGLRTGNPLDLLVSCLEILVLLV